jgi:AraC-like DNA-binding protein
VSDRTSVALLDGPVVGVFDVVCTAPASPPAVDEHPGTTQVVLPLRGCFEVHRGRDATVADVTSAVVLRADEDYRVGHPTDGGDRSFVLDLPAATADEVLATPLGDGLIEPSVRLRAHRVRAAMLDGAADPLEAEEAALRVLEGIARPAGDAASATSVSASALVERTRTVLASRPETRWRLDGIAREVFASPAHLARRFRAATGESIARYLLRLRLGLALERLADGERDLASLAAGLGFASHSHFTARFRTTFGVTPSAFRASLTGQRLDELRTTVTAPGRRRP